MLCQGNTYTMAFECVQNSGLTTEMPAAIMHFEKAGVAQLVEYKLPKLGVAGSNPVARSILTARAHIHVTPA